VIDMQGREIYKVNLSSDELKSGKQIDLGDRTTGLYRILVTSAAGTSGVNLIIQ